MKVSCHSDQHGVLLPATNMRTSLHESAPEQDDRCDIAPHSSAGSTYTPCSCMYTLLDQLVLYVPAVCTYALLLRCVVVSTEVVKPWIH